LTGGPDAFRYLTLGAGKPVSRPFHLRWLLPYFCTTSHRAWWSVFLASWPIAAVGFVGWRVTVGDSLGVALAGAALLLALPGILGPRAVIPVGVDLPSTAVALLGAWVFELGHPTQVVAGVLIIGISAAIKESTPAFAALWLWSPLPLIALCVPACRALLVKPGADPLGERFEHIAAHPVRAALDAHTGRWRDAWVMVAPWGVCLAALVGADWRLLVALGVAYAQLLVATDSVRLYQHAAGPVMAATAASVIPTQYLVLAVALHVVWWRKPERI
jgi:hypothetical protein